MEVVLVVIALILTLAVLTAVIVNVFYNKAFVRGEQHLNASMLGVPWASYADVIIQINEWFESRVTDKVSIKSYDGLSLAATIAEQPDAKGTVIVCHGYRSRGQLDSCCALEIYYNMGFNLVVIDQRSHGNSTGNTITFGLKERYDVAEWVNFVNARYGYQKPVILSGISMGCASVLMSIATKLPDNVCGIVADCGYTSAFEQLRYILKRDYKLGAWPLLYLVNMKFRRKTGCDLREISTEDVLRNNSIPVLFIHGGADDFVPTDFSRRNFKACASDKRLLIVDSAAHGVSCLASPKQYKRALTDFVNSVIKNSL